MAERIAWSHDAAPSSLAGADPRAADSPRSLAAIRLALRQERAVPRLEQFRAWLESQQAQHGGPVRPKSPLGEAISYTLNQWEALTVYTRDGDLAIDNNASENALRRVALGRKSRVGEEDYSSSPLTDPDVQISRIRFFTGQIRSRAGVVAMNDSWRGERKTLQQAVKLVPRERTPARTPLQPFLPYAVHLVREVA